jgi:hypothetical protein
MALCEKARKGFHKGRVVHMPMLYVGPLDCWWYLILEPILISNGARYKGKLRLQSSDLEALTLLKGNDLNFRDIC